MPGAEVAGGSELPNLGAGNLLGPLEKQQLPLTAEPSFQHPSLLPLPAELRGTEWQLPGSSVMPPVSSRIVPRQYVPGQAGQQVLSVPKVTLVFRPLLLVLQKRHL